MNWRRITALVVVVAAALTMPMLIFRWANTASPIFHVYPGEDIQAALEKAAAQPHDCVVQVHAGVYRPSRPGQALIYFNSRHDGVVLEGIGEVTLTAANPDVADPGARSFPAIVNHVVYFGDNVSSQTVLRNFKITGGNGYVGTTPGLIDVKTREDLARTDGFRAFDSPLEANRKLPLSHEFFCDGAGIMVYGRSYPTIENVEIFDNRSTVCGGGVSILHNLEPLRHPVCFKNCVFRNNHAAVSGSAIDVFFPGSWVKLENCLFVGNVSDGKLDYTQGHGYGALSVFPMCKATVSNCTFTDNWSAVDDRGRGSEYRDSIFWNNSRTGGVAEKSRYELDVSASATVKGCFIRGTINDLRSTIPRSENHFDSFDPDFDNEFTPRNSLIGRAGFRSTP